MKFTNVNELFALKRNLLMYGKIKTTVNQAADMPAIEKTAIWDKTGNGVIAIKK